MLWVDPFAAALHALQARAGQLKINHWVRVEAQSQNRLLALTVDIAALDEARKLDGCYVIKTDLLADWATTHGRSTQEITLHRENRVH